MENAMYQILMAVLTVITLVLTYFVVPWLRAKIGNEKLSIIEMWVNAAVAAAEQIFKVPESGASKKTYVMEFLKGKGITITDEELDALIEAAVYELNKAQNLLFTDLALSGTGETVINLDDIKKTLETKDNNEYNLAEAATAIVCKELLRTMKKTSELKTETGNEDQA